MRISSNSFPNSLVNEIQSLNSQQATLQQQLSTGQKVTNPSDDPNAMGRVINRTQEMHSLQQYTSNNTTATNIAQQGYTGLTALKDIATNAAEVATQGASGTTSSDSYQAYYAQVNQMINQALQTANTQSDGNYLFGGTNTASAPFSATTDASGNVTSVAYSGAASGASIPVGEGTTVSPYTDGSTNQGIADFINNLVALRDAMNSQSATGAQAANTSIQSSETTLLNGVSSIGSVQTALEAYQSQNQSRFTSLQTLVSGDTSVDVATASVQLSQTQTAYQAALESGAKIMQTSLLNYIQ